MKIVKADYRIMKPDVDDPDVYWDILQDITKSGRIAYADSFSTGRIPDAKAEEFVKRLIRDGHESVLEHVSMRVLFTVDRGVSHELVRHRLASFTQSSTRYCNYSQDKFGNEITVIRPCYLPDNASGAFNTWSRAMVDCENAYFMMLKQGCTPQEARAVLPNSLKTEVMMTTNLREWRHILNLRAAGSTGKPHPQMLEVMVPLLNELRLKMPALFEDIEPMEV
jgi:thymidylate synthase (FAD)